METQNPSKIAGVVALFLLIFGNAYSGEVSLSLRTKVTEQGSHDAILRLPSMTQTVLDHPSLKMTNTRSLKVDTMIALMQNFTSQSQLPFLQALNQLGVQDIAPFWISNKIALKNLNLEQLEAIEKIPGTFTLREPIQLELIDKQPDEGTDNILRDINKERKVQWGVRKIEAPRVWKKYNKGHSIVVAVIDTGVNHHHESIKSNYGGKWLDPVSGKPDPYDDHGHGTHVIGTICGKKNGIGVAPQAKYIACKGFHGRHATEDNLSKCAQFVMEQKPHVVSNSWGGIQPGSFDDEIASWRAAEIIPIFSIGNSGSQCGTTRYPGYHEDVIGVGATTEHDAVAQFSSRGPTSDRRLKPDVSAPGQMIISACSVNISCYEENSGTSMAAPHVAGTVALILAECPFLDFDEVKSILEETADHPVVSNEDLGCGTGGGEGDFPNYAYGHGRINAWNAVSHCEALRKTKSHTP